jgi:hypothetical protein
MVLPSRRTPRLKRGYQDVTPRSIPSSPGAALLLDLFPSCLQLLGIVILKRSDKSLLKASQECPQRVALDSVLDRENPLAMAVTVLREQVEQDQGFVISELEVHHCIPASLKPNASFQWRASFCASAGKLLFGPAPFTVNRSMESAVPICCRYAGDYLLVQKMTPFRTRSVTAGVPRK